MTRPASSALVLDGEDIKARLIAERTANQTPVHVDWLRFTCYLRNVLPSADALFPRPADEAEGITLQQIAESPLSVADMAHGTYTDKGTRLARLARTMSQLEQGEYTPAAQAYQLAEDVAAALGPEFVAFPETRKGHDFYARRWSIERNGQEVGWVGFGASSTSPRQQAQARTLHCNLYGAACTFASTGWTERMATLIDLRQGDITRCDLALDFFDGLPRGMIQVREDYAAGLMDVGGRRLKPNMVGDWSTLTPDYLPMEGRSFYFGSKEAGKQTNVYEKGHQLFGVKAQNPWIRVELRYGNKLRELCTDMLRRPADFFAGASEWHAHQLAQADAIVTPQPIHTTPRLPLETVAAEVTRNLRWAFDVAAPTIAQAWEFLGEGFLSLVEDKKRPGRLSKFNRFELAQAFEQVKHKFCPPDAGPASLLAV